MKTVERQPNITLQAQPAAIAILHSPMAKKQTELTLHAPHALAVFVAGDFNDWDPKGTPMKRDRRGVWKAVTALTPGRHEYRFIVDGCWTSDPKAAESVPNSFGSENSVRIV